MDTRVATVKRYIDAQGLITFACFNARGDFLFGHHFSLVY